MEEVGKTSRESNSTEEAYCGLVISKVVIINSRSSREIAIVICGGFFAAVISYWNHESYERLLSNCLNIVEVTERLQ